MALVIKDKSSPPAPAAPKPNAFNKPVKLVGMARVPKGFVAVQAELDETGALKSLKVGQPQTFREYIASECKRILHALVLA